MKAGGNDDIIKREYTRWLQKEERARILYQKNGKKNYEAMNILERWILSTINFAKNKTGKELINHDITKKMVSELVDKGIYDQPTAEKMAQLVCLSNPPVERKKLKVSIEKQYVNVGNYSRRLSQERIDLLRKFGNDEQIAIMCLRYSSLVAGSQQWNIPAAVYEVLVNTFKITIEGFASPINSQIIRYPNTKFCSLFPDIDGPFGSVGDFFEYDFVGTRAAINPPYILDIMNATAEKVVATMETAESKNEPTLLFVTVPNWTNTKYGEVLEAKCTESLVKKGGYYYENSNNDDTEIRANFGSTMFIFAYGCDEADYSVIAKAWEY